MKLFHFFDDFFDSDGMPVRYNWIIMANSGEEAWIILTKHIGNSYDLANCEVVEVTESFLYLEQGGS